MNVVVDGDTKILIELAKRKDSDETPKSVVLYLAKAFNFVDPHKNLLILHACMQVRA